MFIQSQDGVKYMIVREIIAEKFFVCVCFFVFLLFFFYQCGSFEYLLFVLSVR